MAYQLFDAAGSVGANRTEAKYAYTDKDFAPKNAICLKEAAETMFWLRLAHAKSLGDRARRAALLRESNELVSTYAAIMRSLKSK